MTSNKKQIVYSILALIGLCATWYFNLQAMQLNPDFSVITFINDNYVNASSASIMNDIVVVALVFLFWSYNEAKTLGISHWWLYVVLTFVIALAFAFPLFMLVRERKLAAV